MEIYVQECPTIQVIPNLPAAKRQVTDGAALFPWALERSQSLIRMQIPHTHAVWPILFKEETSQFERNGCVVDDS